MRLGWRNNSDDIVLAAKTLTSLRRRRHMEAWLAAEGIVRVQAW